MGLKIGHAHTDITQLLPFPNNLTFDRLALFFELFQLREMIHDASFVTCVHARGAPPWPVGRLRAVGQWRLICFPNNLTFDRLALFFEFFQLREMIHDASFVTCVHARGAPPWPVGHQRAVGQWRLICSLPVCLKECARMRGGTQCSSLCDKTLAEGRNSRQCKG